MNMVNNSYHSAFSKEVHHGPADLGVVVGGHEGLWPCRNQADGGKVNGGRRGCIVGSLATLRLNWMGQNGE